MTQLSVSRPDAAMEKKGRGRDWILLPAVCLLTAGVIAISAEALSRHFFPVRQIGFQTCFATNDPTGDAPVKPNSVCWEQMAESRLPAEYKFNSRGHRAGTELMPKQPGTYRIVLIGSSLTQGLFIPRDKTFAALLPAQLSLEAGRKVEIYNEASGGKFRGGPFPTRDSASHFAEVLAAQPDLILWVLTPTDVINAMPEATAKIPEGRSQLNVPPSGTASAPTGNVWDKFQTVLARVNILDRVWDRVGDRLKNRWEQTRTSMVLKHLLLANESKEEYVQSYLKNEDEAGFLQSNPGAKWQDRIENFDAEIAEIAGLAKSAGVPLAAVYVPNRAQAAMISMGDWPSGYDPFQLDRELRQTVLGDGETFVDILPDYKGISDPEQHYFPIDGHPDAGGHAIISRLLAKGLTNGAVPALKTPPPPEIAREPGK